LISSFRDTGSARLEEPQPEARRAKSRGRVIGEGHPAPSQPDRRSAERCELRGGAAIFRVGGTNIAASETSRKIWGLYPHI